MSQATRVPPHREPLDTAAVRGALEGAVRRHDVVIGRVTVVDRTASTSSDLVAGVTTDPADWPDWSVLVADHQAAGRGRAGRTWTTPPRAALTVSVLLRPGVPVERLGWVPLLAGLAVTQAVTDVAGVDAAVKWPNDVLVPVPGADELSGWGSMRKVAGVLAELVAPPRGPGGGAGQGVVVGVGVNVSQTADELPVPSAASLRTAGAGGVDRVALLTAVVDRWSELDRRWRAAGGDAWAAGLGEECSAVCATLGAQVRVELPGDRAVEGLATRLAGDGALEVVDGRGQTRTVLAGDVRHLRISEGSPW